MITSAKLNDSFREAFKAVESGKLKTLIPFLSIFQLNGQPMTLSLHYQLAPMYATVMPRKSVFMFGRQLGKSYALATSSQLRSGLVPYYHTLITEPRADQTQRFNNTIYKPMLLGSPVRDLLIEREEAKKMALKQFRNGSLVYMDYMYLNPDRIRGVSNIATVTVDEAQDVDYEFLSVVGEVTSASINWGFHVYTGTPKTTDTTLALLWNQSSQAEWVIRCNHCGYFNVPNPEQDLLKMLGKIGTICAKCGKPVHPRDGGYVHAYPERVTTFAGYHVSQPTHPLHQLNMRKWSDVLDKVENYPTLKLYNEVLGWPYDAASSPLTMSDLQRASNKIQLNSPADFNSSYNRKYSYIAVGVDWSGGGTVSDSYTSIAICGVVRGSDRIECIYGKRLSKEISPTDETNEIMGWLRKITPDCFAFDNGGAGFTRLEMLKQAGLLDIKNMITIPINYVRPRNGDIMTPHGSRREADLYWYTLDKSRSLAVLVQSLKQVRVTIPEFNETDTKAYQTDLLALREDPRKSMSNDTVILISKKPGVPDDFAHALNFACSAIWDHFGAYPRLGQRYDASILDMDENGDALVPDEVFGPRGDWNRFEDAVMQKALVIEPDMSY